MRTEQRSRLPQAPRLLVWLLLFVLPLQGLTAVLVQGLGTLHFHAQQAAPIGLGDPMQGWLDFRRQVHGAERDAGPAAHAHDGLERHHHAAPDANDAVSVGPAGGDAGPADDATPSPAGALAQVIGPLGQITVLPPTAARNGWATPAPSRLQTRQPTPPERPPRAA